MMFIYDFIDLTKGGDALLEYSKKDGIWWCKVHELWATVHSIYCNS